MNRQSRLFLTALGFLLLLYLGLRYLLPFVLPFALGAFLAAMLEPAVNWLEVRLRLPRAWAAGCALVSAVTVVGGAAFYLTLHLAADIAEMRHLLPSYSQGMVQTLQELAARTQAVYLHLPEPLLRMAEENIPRLYGMAGAILKYLLTALGSVPELLVIFILSCVAAYFLSRDKKAVQQLALHFLPAGSEARLATLEHEVVRSLVGLLWAQLVLVTITTLTVIVGLRLLGIRYAVFLGLVSGLLDILPVLGPTLIFFPWVVGAFLTGQRVLALGLVAVYVAMNIVRQGLQAKIIGSRTGLHPLLVLASLYLGVKLFGPSGLIVGPLTVIVLRALLKAGAFGNFIKM
ncbi:MAG: hypothetical protein PWR31_270 [Bacillota bacterium]|jgi:sporulation integral membrane protein YtvI|nr:hypothetical protein [Bacillota bacterium]MDK2926580.1 hypothetical protein [Bacillota bacterium]